MKISRFLFAALFVSSCQQPSADTPADKQAATTSEAPAATTEEAALYECPMACEGSRSTKPGKCPVCEMELEKKS